MSCRDQATSCCAAGGGDGQSRRRRLHLKMCALANGRPYICTVVYAGVNNQFFLHI